MPLLVESKTNLILHPQEKQNRPTILSVLEKQGLSCETLNTFENPPIPIPEVLGVSLQTTDKPVLVWTNPETIKAGQAYMEMLKIPANRHRLVVVDQPVNNAQQHQENGVIDLVVTSAADPYLKELMFNNPRLGQLFADVIYLPKKGFESPLLHCIGITRSGLKELKTEIQTVLQNSPPDDLAKSRSEIQKPFLRTDQLTFWEFRQLLKSKKVKSVLVHALGPQGTNIAQVALLWTERIGIKDKTEITIYSRGVEPLGVNNINGYAQIAAQQVRSETIPIHIECAVYYRQQELFNTKGEKEVVFADHFNMPLDKMMVAGPINFNRLVDKSRIVIATHPSPKPLVSNWLALNNVEWKQTSSNSVAAEMVANEEADLCITTGQSLTMLCKQLQPIHVYGSPMMTFTIATPLSNQQLKAYL